jgi:hypothetical protein
MSWSFSLLQHPSHYHVGRMPQNADLMKVTVIFDLSSLPKKPPRGISDSTTPFSLSFMAREGKGSQLKPPKRYWPIPRNTFFNIITNNTLSINNTRTHTIIQRSVSLLNLSLLICILHIAWPASNPYQSVKAGNSKSKSIVVGDNSGNVWYPLVLRSTSSTFHPGRWLSSL